MHDVDSALASHPAPDVVAESHLSLFFFPNRTTWCRETLLLLPFRSLVVREKNRLLDHSCERPRRPMSRALSSRLCELGTGAPSVGPFAEAIVTHSEALSLQSSAVGSYRSRLRPEGCSTLKNLVFVPLAVHFWTRQLGKAARKRGCDCGGCFLVQKYRRSSRNLGAS